MGCGANTDCGGKKSNATKNTSTKIVKKYSSGLMPKHVTIKKRT